MSSAPICVTSARPLFSPLSEVAAYNSPYFLIAAMTHDARLLLVFDFTFKIIRAVATTIRATIEGRACRA
jgi:hypothetical protein